VTFHSPDTLRPIFDAHFHIIDKRFPLVTNAGFRPGEFTATDYLERATPLGVVGGVVVSGSFQDFDTTYLVHALDTLGAGFVAVANVRDNASDDDLEHLAAAGIRGVRFNLYRGKPADLDSIVSLGQRAWNVAGMHSEFYLDAQDLEELEPLLSSLPKVSIDHLGMRDSHRDILLRLVGSGVRVKATGFGRLTFNVPATLAEIHAVNPGALMFGSDLPSTRAPIPFHTTDINLLADSLLDGGRGALQGNAVAFYRVPA
jgi:predicted TIM-barrel fold metal-dependent hydrolase